MIRKILLSPENVEEEPIQRINLLRTKCKLGGKCCKVIVDSSSTNNIVSDEMVRKLKLKRMKHPSPYKVLWLEKEHQLVVREQYLVNFQIGK